MTAPRKGVLVCPHDGTVFILTTSDGRLLCHHQSHDGRPKSHPGGYAPQVRRVYSMTEVA